MGLKEFLSGMMEKNRKLKEAQEEDKIRTKIEKTKLSSEERELMERMERQRQEAIKNEVKKMRAEERDKQWNESNNIFKNTPDILKQNFSILKAENMFSVENNRRNNLFGK